MTWQGGPRLGLVLVLGGLTWLGLLGRGAYLALGTSATTGPDAHRQQTEVVVEPGQRGSMYDRTGRLIACTFPNHSIALPASSPAERRRHLQQLQAAGACPPDQAARIRGMVEDRFVWIDRDWVPSALAAHVRETCGPQCLVSEPKRFYPAGTIAPEVLGIVGRDGRALSGLELRYDDWLSGRSGRTLLFLTGSGGLEHAPPAQVLEAPELGGSLLLTIDARLQRTARHRLREGMQRVGARRGFVVLTDPRTGEILAMCEEPSFDPLSSEPIAAEQLNAHCVTDQHEPGSTFKIVPFAAALEAGLISPDDSLDCGDGERQLGSCRIRDHRRFGKVTIREAFSHSSNIGAGYVAERAGWDRCYRMAQALGFGLATGVDLGGEAPGFLPHPRHGGWSRRSLATAAYGQEVACTGLQLAGAFGAIANGGVLMKPLLVKARIDGRGRVTARYGPQVVRRAMSPETAATMVELMRDVVREGTGRAAEITWFPPGGKTGTAQIFDAAGGAYALDEHMLSFVGFAPYDDPRVLCEVCLQCSGDLHAADAAVPIFAAIIKDLAWMLDDAQASPVGQAAAAPRIAVPDVRGLAPEVARRALHRVELTPVLEGLGGCVESMRPQAHRLIPRGAIVHLALGGDAPAGRRVPAVQGLSARRAVSLLAEAGVRAEVDGFGWVVSQDPPAGQVVASGDCCRLLAAPDASAARRDALRRSELVCQTR